MDRKTARQTIRADAATAWMAHIATCTHCQDTVVALLKGDDIDAVPFCADGSKYVDRMNAVLEL